MRVCLAVEPENSGRRLNDTVSVTEIGTAPRKDGEYSSDVFVEFIGTFMEKNRKQPFLVYFPMALVHCPFSPTPDSEEWDPKSHGSKTYKGDGTS